jgi:hypothetical protein
MLNSIYLTEINKEKGKEKKRKGEGGAAAKEESLARTQVPSRRQSAGWVTRGERPSPWRSRSLCSMPGWAFASWALAAGPAAWCAQAAALPIDTIDLDNDVYEMVLTIVDCTQ